MNQVPRPLFFVLETLLHYQNSAVNKDVTFCRCASHLKDSGPLSTRREADLRADPCRLHGPEEDWGLFKKEGQQSWAAGSMQPVLHPHPSWFWVRNLWLYSWWCTNTVKNNSSETVNVCPNVLFFRLKTPPIIRTEDELKEKIALLEVKRVL